jgi:hypothetical protein
MPNFASVSGLSVLCLVCLMLPVSLDCPFLIAPSVFSNLKFIVTNVKNYICNR